MKHLLLYIVFFLGFFNCSAGFAALPTLPDDFEGEITRIRLERLQNDDYYDQSMAEYGIILWEIGKYFYEKYPDITQIDDDELAQQLQPFFPDDSDEELLSRTALLRNVIVAYRAASQFYNSAIAEKLVPHAIKTVHSAADYDHPDEVPYIEAKDGHFIKVYNFKKFLTYSHNNDEKAAIEAFERSDPNDDSILNKFDYAVKQIEWKKFPFYGIKYQNPLLSTTGISAISKGQNFDLRLLSRRTYIDGSDELDIGVQIHTDDAHFILADDVSEDLSKINIDLSQSQNIADYEVLYPAPFAAKSLPAYHKYFGDFLIPIKIKIADPSQPLVIKAEIDVTSCGNALVCYNEVFYPELTVEPSGNDIFPNGYENFFAQTLAQIPTPTPQKLHLHKFVVDPNDKGESLRLEFDVEEKMQSFQVYVTQKDGNTLFSAPLISFLDNRIYVRFFPLEAKESLKDSEFVVTAVLNDQYFYRDTLIAGTVTPFDLNALHLNIGLILLAILGGFILNFMPCVFPVLSLKIMSLCRQNQNPTQLHRSALQTAFGILCGFTLIIIALVLTKMLGYSLGWGMQFQNMSFLVTMTFVLVCFIILAPQLNWQNSLQNKWLSEHPKADFLIGTLIVLLSTPCTGPYLATAIGFALTGGYADIVVLLYAVALGLSLPYLLIACLKQPQTLLPHAGPWMNTLNFVMRIMLYLTIGWFFLLIYEQTDIWCIVKICALLLFFCAVFWLYRNFVAFLDERFAAQLPSETELKIRDNAKYFLLPILVIVIILSAHIAQKSYHLNYERHMQNRLTGIDTALIEEKIAQGHSVLLEIGADWCLTCHYNTATVLTAKNLDYWQRAYKLDFMRVDWTNYNADTLEFMARYGRKGLPFYILYTPTLRDGIVLPEIFDKTDIESKLKQY